MPQQNNLYSWYSYLHHLSRNTKFFKVIFEYKYYTFQLLKIEIDIIELTVKINHKFNFTMDVVHDNVRKYHL